VCVFDRLFHQYIFINGVIYLNCVDFSTNKLFILEQLIGRTTEIEILKSALNSNKSEMVSVIGRRRVGKTFLISQVYARQIVFSVTGIQAAPLEDQLENFTYNIEQFSKAALPAQSPKTWLRAFMLLIEYLETVDFSKKRVVFLDELPWLSTHKSGFLRGLSFFWNSWAVNKNIVVVICGSSASWMIKKVVHHRGGLHNRITKRIYLAPFTLSETEAYLKHRNLHFTRYHIVQMYMAFGGIPHYLEAIKQGESATQNINRICFSKNGLLRDEFLKLYPSLFSNADHHILVIRALAGKRLGMTRKEIINATKLSAGGSLQRVLEELEQSGFIKAYRSFGKKKKEKNFRLIDEYSLFYLQFIENNPYEGDDTWNHLSQTPSYTSWSGYSFEGICMKHLPQIKKVLGISGIYSVSASFLKRGTDTEKGTQIDLVLDRKDQVINLFEIKFSNKLYSISKTYFENLSNKINVFETSTKTKKQLFLVFITPFGLLENQYSSAIVAKSLTLDDLF